MDKYYDAKRKILKLPLDFDNKIDKNNIPCDTNAIIFDNKY